MKKKKSPTEFCYIKISEIFWSFIVAGFTPTRTREKCTATFPTGRDNCWGRGSLDARYALHTNGRNIQIKFFSCSKILVYILEIH